jgi:hypothetical protein
MRWKIATVALAVVLAAVIGLGEWQISSERHQAITREAQLLTVIVGDRVAQSRATAALTTQTENAISKVSGATVGGIENLIGSNPIGNSLTGAISNLQREVSCLETDITDLENQSTTYFQCN